MKIHDILKPVEGTLDLTGILNAITNLGEDDIGYFAYRTILKPKFQWGKVEHELAQIGFKITSILYPTKSLHQQLGKKSKEIMVVQNQDSPIINLYEYSEDDLDKTILEVVKQKLRYTTTQEKFQTLYELEMKEKLDEYHKAFEGVGTISFTEGVEIKYLRDNRDFDFYLPKMLGVAQNLVYLDVSYHKNPTNAFYGVKVDQEIFDPEYLVLLLESEYGAHQIDYGITHVIRKERYQAIQLPRLSIERQKELVLKHRELDDSIEALTEQKRSLLLRP